MEYAKSINAVAAVLGAEATVVSRYNRKPRKQLERNNEQSEGLNTRQVKLVVADYGNNRYNDDFPYDEISFHLYITQVRYVDGRVVEPQYAIDQVKLEEESYIERDTIEEVLVELGLGLKYTPALKSILAVFEEMTGNKVIFGGGKVDAEAQVALYVRDGDDLLLMQFRE